VTNPDPTPLRVRIALVHPPHGGSKAEGRIRLVRSKFVMMIDVRTLPSLPAPYNLACKVPLTIDIIKFDIRITGQLTVDISHSGCTTARSKEVRKKLELIPFDTIPSESPPGTT